MTRLLRYALADVFQAFADLAAWIDTRLADACNDPEDEDPWTR